jgi:hypothetical protein
VLNIAEGRRASSQRPPIHFSQASLVTRHRR